MQSRGARSPRRIHRTPEVASHPGTTPRPHSSKLHTSFHTLRPQQASLRWLPPLLEDSLSRQRIHRIRVVWCRLHTSPHYRTPNHRTNPRTRAQTAPCLPLPIGRSHCHIPCTLWAQRLSHTRLHRRSTSCTTRRMQRPSPRSIRRSTPRGCRPSLVASLAALAFAVCLSGTPAGDKSRRHTMHKTNTRSKRIIMDVLLQ